MALVIRDLTATRTDHDTTSRKAQTVNFDVLTLSRLALPDQGGAGDATAWQEAGLCAQTDPEVFFPEKGGSSKPARFVCQSCEVRQQCLDSALANDERFGIWGGLSERERRRLKKSQGAGGR